MVNRPNKIIFIEQNSQITFQSGSIYQTLHTILYTYISLNCFIFKQSTINRIWKCMTNTKMRCLLSTYVCIVYWKNMIQLFVTMHMYLIYRHNRSYGYIKSDFIVIFVDVHMSYRIWDTVVYVSMDHLTVWIAMIIKFLPLCSAFDLFYHFLFSRRSSATPFYAFLYQHYNWFGPVRRPNRKERPQAPSTCLLLQTNPVKETKLIISREFIVVTCLSKDFWLLFVLLLFLFYPSRLLLLCLYPRSSLISTSKW